MKKKMRGGDDIPSPLKRPRPYTDPGPRRIRSRINNQTQPQLEYQPNQMIPVENGFRIELGHYERPRGVSPQNINPVAMFSPLGTSKIRPKTRGEKFNEGYYHKSGKNINRPYSKTFREDCDRDLYNMGMRSIRDALTCLATMVSSLHERIQDDLRRRRVDENHFRYNVNMWERIQRLYARIQDEFEPKNASQNELIQFDSQMTRVMEAIQPQWKDWFPEQLDRLRERVVSSSPSRRALF
jgi:hypothetical protein